MKNLRMRILVTVLVLCLVLQPAAVFADTAAPGDTVVDVLTFGADPTGVRDSTEAIWNALQEAKKLSADGKNHVTLDFPKGEYHIYKDKAQTREYHTSNTNSVENPIKTIGLLIEDQKNLTLEGNGSLFMLHGNMMALAVVRSENILLHNFAWDFAVPTVSEMTVRSVTGSTVEYYIPACFPYEVTGSTIRWSSDPSPYTGEPYWTATGVHNSYGITVYYPEAEMTRIFPTNVGPFSNVSGIEEVSKGIVRITYWGNVPEMAKPGHVIQLTGNAHRETAGAFTWESKNVTADHVNVHFMHGFGWLVQMSENVYYRSCNLMPRPGSGHIATSFADGIHASGAKGQFVIENCNFAHTHDDPINMHGTFTRVEERRDDHTLVLRYVHAQQGGFPQYHVGDKVQFFTRDTLESTDGEAQYTVKRVISNPGENGNDLKHMVIEFEEALPASLSQRISGEPKYVAENVTYAPSVTIKGCTFKNVATRSILCTTRNPVIIEDNVFYPSSMAAIFLSNDSNDWYESGPIRNMTIRNNVFYVDDIGGRTSWPCAPAIWVHPVTKNNGLPAASNPIHKNITVEGNTFFMDEDMVVKGESVENFRFLNNRIFRMNPDITLEIQAAENLSAGQSTPLTVRANGRSNTKNIDNLFEFKKSKDVLISGNHYDDGMKNYIVAEDEATAGTLTNEDGLPVVYDRNQPASAPVSNIRFASSNPDVAYVDEDRNIVGKSAGTAQIIAYYEWNDTLIRSNTVTVTVDGSAASGTLQLLPAEPAPVQAGTTVKLSVQGVPANVTWSVSDFLTGQATEAASIAPDGTLTARTNGIVWVTATTPEGSGSVPVEIYGAPIHSLNTDFSVTREDPDMYQVDASSLAIRMQAGDLYNETNTVKNLFLYDSPELTKNNLRTVVRVSGMPVRENGQWDTASFVLYRNDDNYVTVGKKSHFNGFASVVEKNGSAAETNGSSSHNSVSDAYLGMTVQGNTVTLDCKVGDGPWTQVRQLTTDVLGTDYKIGMACWHTHDRNKQVTFSDFHAGSADISYEDMMAQPAIPFLKTVNDRPQVSDVRVTNVNGDPTVSYTFRDADGEGRSLYLWSWMQDGQQMTKVTETRNFGQAGVSQGFCRVYPVDTCGEPGTPSEQVAFTVDREDTAELHSIAVNGQLLYQRGGSREMTVTIPAEYGKLALQYASVNDARGTTAITVNGQPLEGAFPNSGEIALAVRNGDTVKLMRDGIAYTVTVRTVASDEAELLSASIAALNFTADVTGTDAVVIADGVQDAVLTLEAVGQVRVLRNEYRQPLEGSRDGQHFSCPIHFNNGINTFYIQVLAEDGKTCDTYRIHVVFKPDSTVSVSGITLDGKALDGFRAEQKSYVYSMAADRQTLQVAVAAQPDADVIIALNGTVITGSSGEFNSFRDGANELVIRARAADGITEAVYTVTVIKPYDANAVLQSAVLGGQDITAKLGSTAAELYVGRSTVSLQATAQDSRATVRIFQGSQLLAEAAGQAQLELTPYDNDRSFTVQITAADGTAVSSYPFTLTRSVYVSDLNWTSATVGWTNQVQKDRNYSGDTMALADAQGKPVTFEKGLGTHAESIIKYDVDGMGYTAIAGYAGLDYSQYNATYGSVTFQIFADETCIYNSEERTQKSPMVKIQVNIPAGTRQITLKALPGANNWNDHCDWADLKFVGSFGLRPAPDKTQLADALAAALEKNQADYTADSWAAFAQARQQAMTVNEDANATQAQVTEALAALNAAAEALQKKLNITGTNMTLGNELAMNFMVKKSGLSDLTGLSMQITKTFADNRPDVVITVPVENWKDYNEYYYAVTFDDISAKEMTDTITAVIMRNGEPAGDAFMDSVEHYAIRILRGSKATAKLKSVIVDMLNYGTEAQKYFKYHLDTLANAQLTAEEMALASDPVITDKVQVKGDRYFGSNLNLGNSMTMTVYFKGITPDMHAVISYTKHTGEKKEIPVSGADFVRYNDTVYGIRANTLVVADAQQPVTVTVYDAKNQVVGSGVDSIADYVNRANLGELGQSILKFAASAETYFSTKK